MWTRFFPINKKCREIINNGEIGDVLMCQADFGKPMSKDNPRKTTTKLGGGALLDVGIYPMGYMPFCFGDGAPTEIKCTGKKGDTE